MISESWILPRRERRSSRDSIFGFHPEVFGEDVADAASNVEKAGFALVEIEDGKDAETKPWQEFAKRQTQLKKKTRWNIGNVVDALAMIVSHIKGLSERVLLFANDLQTRIVVIIPISAPNPLVS